MGVHEIHDDRDAAEARAFMKTLLDDLAALETMLASGAIESGVSRIGAEQEMFLVDGQMRPAPVNLRVLDRLRSDQFTTEIGRYNLEANLTPRAFETHCLRDMEAELEGLLAQGRSAAAAEGAQMLLCGILPTIRPSDLTIENLTPAPRYQQLDRIMRRLRGEQFHLLIRGLDELQITHDNVVLEACCTSFQVHFQVSPSRFASLYNLAQAVAAPVLAAAVNSPLLLGHRLWQETRIAVFQHSVDERSAARVARDHPTRVGFGERWVNESVIEILREDIARYRVIFTKATEENALETLAAGNIPKLAALRLHNGTIWRWNRPCYGVTNGKPHLRIEARAIPAGPTVLDEMANGAFFFGLLCGMKDEYPEISKNFCFGDAKQNFISAARHGLDAQFVWIGGRRVPASTLILEQLLPLAREGLAASGIDSSDIDRYLGVIEERVVRDQTGAQWMLRSLAAMEDSQHRDSAQRRLTAAMLENQRIGRPVHEWRIVKSCGAESALECYRVVSDVMSTDLFTVRPDDLAQLAASIMEWRHIRHVPVEDEEGNLAGLVSHRELLALLARPGAAQDGAKLSVRTIMNPAPVTVSPETPTVEALDLMRRHRVDCVPVIHHGKLAGILTTHDLIDVLASLLDRRPEAEKAAGGPA